MQDIISRIKETLKNKKLPVHDEKLLQSLIEVEFKKAGIIANREYVLSKKDKVDFFIDGAAIEVKIKGSPMAIYRQLVRYAKNDEVLQVVLITAKRMTLPEKIENKPATLIYISGAWL